MNIYEYVNDPSLAPQTNRDNKQAYMAKLNDIIIRENKLPHFEIYKDDDNYWFYFQIPDANLKNVKYDVVLEFIPKNEKSKASMSIGDYDVKFFSNDPGFIYYYCWCFNHEGLLIERLKFKLNQIALTQAPDKTNPEHKIRMCKSFYFAYLLMEKMNLFSKEAIGLMHPQKFVLQNFVGKIKTDANVRVKLDKNIKINRFEKKVKKTVKNIPKEIEKKTNEIVDKAVSTFTRNTGSSKKTSSSKRTTTTRTVGKAKTQKTIGKTRKH